MTGSHPPIAVTMGEPAGIGGELTLAAWLSPPANAAPFFAIDDPRRLRRLAEALGRPVPIVEIEKPEAGAAAFADALPVLPVALPTEAAPGRPDPACADAVLSSIRLAVELAQSGRAAAVVTNPIQKAPLYQAGFRHPGHTEYLAELAGAAAPPVMMLVARGLRVVPVTVHVPLAAVPKTLSGEAIVHCGRVAAAALRRDFGVDRPRLAVAGLNPHAGEGGALGHEEIDVIAPAVETLRRDGIDVSGPAPADSLFHDAARRTYDAALCMYHDQALIPLKTVDFAGGVNVTLGLPFVRTSPDHGTALDIAGTGAADPSSFLAALALARDISTRRGGAESGEAGRAAARG